MTARQVSPGLLRVDNRDGLRKLSEQLGIIGIGVWMVASFSWLGCVFGLLTVGFGFARNLEIVHECIHKTAFRGRLLSLNTWIGTLFGVPMGVSYAHWTYAHMAHHRDVRIEGFSYDLDRLSTIRDLLRHILMIAHWAAVARRVVMALTGNATAMRSDLAGAAHVAEAKVPERVVQRSMRDHRIIAGFFLALAALVVVLPVSVFPLLLLWTSACIFHVLIELPEHLGTDTSSVEALDNSREVDAGKILRWLSNNNNYHAAHHWAPGVPISKLPEVHATIRTEVRHLCPSYLAFYREFIAGFLRRRQEAQRNRNNRH